MTSSNGLICFTNCLLAQEDGRLIEKDLWIDERCGKILDAQRTFFARKERPARIIDLGGNVLSPGLIDIQINGAYGFDFSVYEGNDDIYRTGLANVAEKIVETGVTSLVPTIITQESSLYPSILPLLRPRIAPKSANLLGWHAEGPFLQPAKRGAHAPAFILPAPEGIRSFETVYGAPALADAEDWHPDTATAGVRIITTAPEVAGVLPAVKELAARGVVVSIGHSVASSAIAGAAVASGARLITHLFNAMPQLHHRDPAIIGLLGASPSLANTFIANARLATEPASLPLSPVVGSPGELTPPVVLGGEALSELRTPPQSPTRAGKARRPTVLAPAKAGEALARPFYELIVDGVHLHPNSVRLAYSAFPEGCVLVTDAMKILDPHLADGVHEWRDGQMFVKDGDRLFLEGTDTLAGSVVTLDKCVRNFTAFTGAGLGDSIRCATYNPAKCMGLEDRKGTLRAGADADLVVFDQDGNVLQTWVAGTLAWEKSA